jgi:hypothetical protein
VALGAPTATLTRRDIRKGDGTPLTIYWAGTQNNLGAALWALGERESGTARLKEAVAAFRAAREEWTRDRLTVTASTWQPEWVDDVRARANETRAEIKLRTIQ